VACGAAELPAVGGGKDCLRSKVPLVEQPQQAPIANSEALPLPLLLNRQEADAVQCRQWEWHLQITILRPSGALSLQHGGRWRRCPQLGGCRAWLARSSMPGRGRSSSPIGPSTRRRPSALSPRPSTTSRTTNRIGRDEALRRSMLSLISSGGRNAHPANWAPFVVVGEGAK
jgi:hypothetical protein